MREARGATMRLEQEVCLDNALLASAEVTIACVDRSGLKPRRLPRVMLDTLRNAQVH